MSVQNQTQAAASAALNGLASQEAEARLGQFGPNDPARPKNHSAVFDFLRLFLNPLVLILLIAALVSAFLGEAADAAIIAVIVLLSTALDFTQTYKSQRAIGQLRQQVAPTATVLRESTSPISRQRRSRVWCWLNLASAFFSVASRGEQLSDEMPRNRNAPVEFLNESRPRVLNGWRFLMKVCELMGPQVVTVGPKKPLREILQLMLRYHLNDILIVDSEQRLAGIVTYPDLCRKLIPTERDLMEHEEYITTPQLMEDRVRDIASIPVDEIMTRSVITVSPDFEALKAGWIVAQRSYRDFARPHSRSKIATFEDRSRFERSA